MCTCSAIMYTNSRIVSLSFYLRFTLYVDEVVVLETGIKIKNLKLAVPRKITPIVKDEQSV